LLCTASTCLLVESSSFFSCKTSNLHGGAIYISGNGQCVLHKVCGYDCSSTNTGSSSAQGQFAWITVNNAGSSKSYLSFSSIVRCVNQNSNSRFTVCYDNGKIYCPSINVSMNKCQLYSGIYIDPYDDPNVFTSLTYSSLTDNTATGYICIYLESGNVKYELKSCNILRNTQGSLGSYGTIYALQKTMIDDSCILENKATYIFYASSTITLTNCTVDSISKTGNVIIQSTATKSFILALNHMSTRNCHSEYDSAGTLTPDVQTPSSSKKQKIYCSCEKCFYQIVQVNFVLLTSVFIFNFIYPYASNDLW
jgi:hypothetical protein